ncbi:PD-(D/E)XK nuclease family protein [Hylemonella gracilis]|uniref:PD-(D/E)XK nuclease family protein n=1 Tax=Hylemonella gracilis TaxID=80880 RepID=A0A4P6UQP2_9BURK|nr:PD-(D/E)XK nuclease family protein [Hylemonella gracilis]QBK06487.1 PD-(D/E)XK nuclease family protein [Hylemonella gracilis]
MNHRWRRWLEAVAESLRARGVHPARAVVLLPYAQLMPVAARLWGARYPVGFAPRFETTQNWAQALAGTLAGTGASTPGQDGADLRFKPALDLLTAHVLLEQAGLGAQAAVAAPLLLEAAQQLAPLAAAQPPAQRVAWGQRASHAARTGLEDGLEGQVLRLEAAVAQIAVAWVVNSSYGSDVFFSSEVRTSTDGLLVLPGLQPDPLVEGLRQAWGDDLVLLDPTVLPGETASDTPVRAPVSLHAATDAADEAERAAACILRHLQAGRVPVAVAVIDRALTRRVRAMLARHGVQMRDETGWKLSTTRAGAQVMAALRACARDASSDAVLDWLKHAPACDELALRALEAALRRQPRRLWRHAVAGLAEARQGRGAEDEMQSLLRDLESWRAAIMEGRGTRTLQEWLDALQAQLSLCGLWDTLMQDEAGRELAGALHYALDETGRAAPRLPAEALWARRRWSLSEFTSWVDRALESAIFKPAYPLREQAVLLPLAQMLGRDFGAIVLPGCDERSLPAAPEPGGPWTAAQRAALGLPTREALQAAQEAAWEEALSRACPVDILWRGSDADGEPLLASSLVQRLQLEARAQGARRLEVGFKPRSVAGLAATGDAINQGSEMSDPRDRRVVAPTPTPRPAPRLLPPWTEVLRPGRLSASAYQDLRHCPYRFHALRLLGLREAEEIEGELDKRDFGLWLHAVLQTFHAQDLPDGASREARATRLDAAAQAVAREQRLADDEFLPFQAAWPRLRDGYLDWLATHEAEGWRFALGEHPAEQALTLVTLFGRLDRVDRASGGLMVMDYKTEAEQTTRARVKEALEDTQLAFYAALLPEPGIGGGGLASVPGASDEGGAGLRAAYVNVGEGETRLHEQPEIAQARAALLEGLVHDLTRIGQGAPLPPLGEGAVCDTCAARGLCRKDFWNE